MGVVVLAGLIAGAGASAARAEVSLLGIGALDGAAGPDRSGLTQKLENGMPANRLEGLAPGWPTPGAGCS